MLLRLVPEQSCPTVLFTLAFTNLPDSVPFPQNWSAQLQGILQDELELPNCIHALDKSVWASVLLHEVLFCMASRTISCSFIDGTRKEWPMANEKFITALQNVLEDVTESGIASEMEAHRARVIAEQAEKSRSTSPVKVQRHKRSRSILMTIVA